MVKVVFLCVILMFLGWALWPQKPLTPAPSMVSSMEEQPADVHESAPAVLIPSPPAEPIIRNKRKIEDVEKPAFKGSTGPEEILQQ